MDTKQFDDLIKDLGSTRLTRATALRGFLAGLAAAVAGSAILSEDSDAKKKRRNKNKRRKSKHKKRKGNVRSQVAGPEVSPCLAYGNPECSDLGLTGSKVDPPASGCQEQTILDANGNEECKCVVCYDVTFDGDKPRSVAFGGTGDATTNPNNYPACVVGTVIVKGGSGGGEKDTACGFDPNGNNPGYVYTYNPGVTADDGLVAPLNPNGQNADISHFNFCNIQCPECVKRTCDFYYNQSPPVCGNGLDDGCGGTIDCPCCKSCTIGYYSQNNTCNGLTEGGEPLNSLDFPCAKGTVLGDYCAKYDADSNGLTIGEALTARGNDVVCAQAAAAYLNQVVDAVEANSCAAGVDWSSVCNNQDLSQVNSQLTKANEGFGICPLKGCKKK